MFRAIRQKIKHSLNARFAKFLSRRMPPKKAVVLSNKNIFILPTKFGLVFVFFVLLLFLLGTNYQNNVIILFSYLLISFFVTSMLHTFYNLSGLTLKQSPDIEGFVDQALHFPVLLSSTCGRFNLHFNLKDQSQAQLIELAAEGQDKAPKISFRQLIEIPFVSGARGIKSLGRLRVSSEYSFGLFNAWTQIEFQTKAKVFPKPIPLAQGYQLSDVIEPQEAGENDGFNDQQSGVDDFYALKNYQQGEPLSHVDWKQVARKRGWYTKDYRENNARDIYLNLQAMPANDVERKLSMLCFLILELHQKGQTYGVKLQEHKIAADSGQRHLNECLTALATFKNGGERLQ